MEYSKLCVVRKLNGISFQYYYLLEGNLLVFRIYQFIGGKLVFKTYFKLE